MKLRAAAFREGLHDYTLGVNGMAVYPRLIASEHGKDIREERLSSGLPALDAMFGGGIERGSSTLVRGPTGVGKSSVTMQYAYSAALRGERAVVYYFDETLRTARQRTNSVGMHIDGEIDGGEHHGGAPYQNTAPICCYPGELRQVFANLIGNAFDALREEGGRILLRERAATHPKSGRRGVRATIADNGQGVSADTKATLFAVFHSTKGSNKNGLGLWISKGIVEKHHGSIRFRSSTKAGCSGTLFSVFIPLEQAGG